MEQRLSEWPKTSNANTTNTTSSSSASQQQTNQNSISHHHHQQHQQQQQKQFSQTKAQTATTSLPIIEPEKTITSLEYQVEEQRQLRLQDARQIEAKAAKIKEWVNNKLRDLEEQNQLLREQNQKCNQQLELLRNYISNQSNRHSIVGPVRNSLSLDVPEFHTTKETRRRSESLDTQELNINNRPLTSSYPHHQHRGNLNMEPAELERNLVTAVDGLNLAPLSSLSKESHNLVSRPNSSDTDTAHDYAEIYTPSCEKTPAWLKNNLNNNNTNSNNDLFPGSKDENIVQENVNDQISRTIIGNATMPRPPTPPLHRFPSWEAKIYQVANDGLTTSLDSFSTQTTQTPEMIDSGHIEQIPTLSSPAGLIHSTKECLQESMKGANSICSDQQQQPEHRRLKHSEEMETNPSMETQTNIEVNENDLPGTYPLRNRQQQTASGGFCDISVPVYATVKGVNFISFMSFIFES